MAGRFINAETLGVSLVGATRKTLIQMSPATNHAILVHSLSVSPYGVVPTAAPIQVAIGVQTDPGAADTLVLTKRDEAVADTIDSTARDVFTVEPGLGNAKRVWGVHPMSRLDWVFDPPLMVPAGTRIGVWATAPDAVTVDAFIEAEE